MADTNTSISIVCELIDKATAPLAALREQIAEFGALAQNTTATPINPAVNGTATAGLSAELAAASTAAAATEQSLAAMDATKMAAVATSSAATAASANAAAIALTEADVAESRLAADSVDTSETLQAVAVAAAEVNAEMEQAAASAGDTTPTGKPGLNRALGSANSSMRQFHNQIIGAIASIGVIEAGLDIVSGLVARAGGDSEKFANNMAAAEKSIQSIPLFGTVIDKIGKEINNALNLPQINIKDGVIDLETFNEGWQAYDERVRKAAKDQDQITQGMKDLNESKRAELEIQSRINAISAQANELEAVNSRDEITAGYIRLQQQQSAAEMALKLSKFGTEEAFAQQSRLDAAQQQAFVHQSVVKIIDDQSKAERTFADDVQQAHDLEAEGIITQDEMNNRIAQAKSIYESMTTILEKNAAALNEAKGGGPDPDEATHLKDRARQAAADARDALNPLGVGIRQGLQDPLDNFFTSAIMGMGTLKQLGAQLLTDLAGELANFLVKKEVTKFLNLFGGGADQTNPATGQASGGIFQAIGGFVSTLFLAEGGIVPGSGTGDTVPAMLTPGEFIVNRSAAQQHAGLLAMINNSDAQRHANAVLFPAPSHRGLSFQHFAAGGMVQPQAAAGGQHGAPVVHLATIAPSYENHMNLLNGSGAALVDYMAQNARAINSALGHA